MRVLRERANTACTRYVRARKVAGRTTMSGSGAFSPAWKPPKRDARDDDNDDDDDDERPR